MGARFHRPASTVFILAVSSDIGEQLALHHLGSGSRVFGTYRTRLPASLRQHPNFRAIRCDVAKPGAAAAIRTFLRRHGVKWSLFISCVGQLAPVGAFFKTPFETWARSVETNSLAQLRALHAAYPFRRSRAPCHVVFFAGGGTNGPFRHYSAYCLGKLALIKMCELLDDECPRLNVFIVGTGWVRTKIHRQTLAAGARAGENLGRTKRFLRGGAAGASHADIAAMIEWAVARGRTVAGGRNFSLVHDDWRRGDGAELATALRARPDMFKLRRHGNPTLRR